MPRNSQQYCCADTTLAAILRLPLSSNPLWRILFCLLLSAFCLTTSLYAQSATATLSGTVEDPTGAVVPGASMTLISANQASLRRATTNGEGVYVFPLLPPDSYSITVTAPGFAPREIKGIVLNVDDQRVLNISLPLGNITQTIEIVEGAALISESPSVGNVVNRQFIENIPLNGRSVHSLITLVPGVVLARTNGNNPGQFSVNGQRTNTNYFTVDGVSANIGIRATNTLSQTAGGSQPGFNAFGGTNNLASVDALQEFKMLTSTYAPEFGRTPGAQISMVTRSGGNDFHGTLFNYFRNDALDATDWFANANKTGKPPLRQNDFGGVFSGPVLLPRFGEGGSQPGYNGRNRTFFFFSYEGLRQQLPQVATNFNVPSLNLRQAAPASLQPLLRAFPLPTGPENPATQLAPLVASFSSPASLDATSLRIDHTFNDRVTLFGRFNYAPSESVQRGGTSFTLSTVNPTKIDTQTLTIGSTQILSNRLTNELRANWSRTIAKSFFIQDDFGGAVAPPDSVWFPTFASSENDRINLTLLFGTSAGITVGNSAANQQRQINIVDSLSLVTGNHQLKFGADYRRLSPLYGPQAYFQGLTFNNAAAVRTGIVSSVSIVGSQGVEPIYTNFSAFAQDTWKLSKQRLTITYGLRYEVNPPPSEADGKEVFNVIGLENPSTARLAPAGTPLYKTTYNNFAPRIGLAYQLIQTPGQETVLRGGFGLFYDLGNGQTSQGFTSIPYAGSRPLANVPYPLSAAAAAPFSFSATPPFASTVVIRTFDPNLKLPRTYQWNLAVERSLGSSQTVSASYVAAAGRRLLRQVRFLTPVPSLGASVDLTNNDGDSDYHAMQLQYNRRLSRGLQTLASYTWSHSIDNASDEFSDMNLARAVSDFDIRHVFNAALTYDLPTPSIGRVGKAILRNFSLDGMFTARSAAPVNVIARMNQTLFGETQHIRPDLILGVPLYLNDPTLPGGKRFNSAAFSLPPAGRQGTLGRNALRGFPLSQIDLSLRRQFNFTERRNLQVRADLFNIFNHPNFGDPEFIPGHDLVYSSVLANGTPVPNPTFGISRFMFGRAIGRFGGGFSPLYQVGGPRSVQLSLKLQF
jgi:hypothetical protein